LQTTHARDDKRLGYPPIRLVAPAAE